MTKRRTNYWYTCKNYQIFLDLDSNRAIARALSVLRLVVRQKLLPIHKVYLFKTSTRGHAHMIIELADTLAFAERVAWSLWLGSDRLRASYVLARRTRGLFYAEDLFMTPKPYNGQFVETVCHCKGKHKEKRVTSRCPAMKRLLRDHRNADYFARTGAAPPKHKIRVPWGRVSLDQLKDWRPRP